MIKKDEILRKKREIYGDSLLIDGNRVKDIDNILLSDWMTKWLKTTKGDQQGRSARRF